MENLRRNTKNRDNTKTSVLPSKQDGLLLSSAKIASSKAIRSSMALGITIKVIRNNEIISISPDKTVKVLRKISRPTIDLSALKKGIILERK